MGIGETLRKLRKEKHLTQIRLSEETGISVHSINSYESGRREPNSKAMAALEQYFNVSGGYLRGETDEPFLTSWGDKEIMEHVHDALSRISSMVVEKARSSDECSKKMVYDILNELRHVVSLEPERRPASMMLLQEIFCITTRFIDSCLYSVIKEDSWFDSMKRQRVQDFIAALNNFEFGKGKSNKIALVDFGNNVSAERKEIAVFSQPAAAGTGTFLDSDDYDIVDVPIDPITSRASFGVRVSGDSMEPNFTDEDIVFVKQQRTLDNGEIGVFVLNGDAFIKKLVKSKEGCYLISLNIKYNPITVHSHDELRVVGKVIGRYIED